MNYISSRNKLVKDITGNNNSIMIGTNLGYNTLHIIMKGNDNTVEIGNNCHFSGENWIFLSGDNNHLIIGDDVTFDDDVHFILSEGTQIKVGNDCMFAKHINIRTSNQHGIYDKNNKRTNIAKNVCIGNHVWIGASVLIMKGVNIGNGAMIGIRSMVTKDIPDNCVAAGQPANVLKENIHWTREL